jgi:hypothetical protein
MITSEPWYAYTTLPQETKSYTLIEAGKADYALVTSLYERSSVARYYIGRVEIIHNPAVTHQFEARVRVLNAKADEPPLQPTWHTENCPIRKQIHTTLQQTTAQHGSTTHPHVQFIPLFYGAKAPLVESILKIGFEDPATTNNGPYGKGIYTTSHAAYAHCFGDGTLLVNWIAFFSAYPVTQADTLQGNSSHLNYDAHYTLVAPQNTLLGVPNEPQAPYCPIARATQDPTYDELVVFQSSHILPRYLITLFPDTLQPLLCQANGLTLMMSIGAYISQADGILQPLLKQQITKLGTQLDTPLTQEQLSLLTLIERSKGETNPTNKTTLAHRITQLLEVGPQTKVVPLPPQAFGKARWATHFGDIGIEPPLPPDIHTILESPCPFWPGKKTKETHLLTLIPATINGQPLTLNTLEQLIQNPKQGHKTKYKYYWEELKKERGNTPVQYSHWVLMPRDAIPGSRNKSYSDQQKLVAQYPTYRVSQVLEAAVSELMEHVVSGVHLYGQNPWTFIRCEENVKGHQIVVGGAGPDGLNVSDYSFWDRDNNGVAPVRKF